MGPAGMRILAKFIPPQLTLLGLNQADLTLEAVRALAPALPQTLKNLRLYSNPIDDEGAELLAKYLPDNLDGIYFDDVDATEVGEALLRAKVKPGDSYWNVIFGRTGLAMAAYVHFQVPETKGKLLEEMDEVFKSKSSSTIKA
ncbi:hypothetical protein H9P43_009045 [Blastocladiella emersonii ATCC 22665]|nr:hypothetical protein H9P43_009045 [Blastocladiella emersonii ATCC 22665]